MSLVPELCKPNLLYVNSTCTINLQMCEYKIINLKTHTGIDNKGKKQELVLKFCCIELSNFKFCKYGGLSTAAIN